jgi:magnesium chelatase subunit I
VSRVFPFSAIVGQSDMKLAMMIAAVDRSVGGVLLFGDRGTGKSTAVRALAGLLPKMRAVVSCPYACSPETNYCATAQCGVDARGDDRKSRLSPVPVVDLPLGVTEDRVVGALDIEKALVHGEKSFDPGLLARANRGFLYIDEVNLLEDHIVDLLLDVAASGENVVEREGLSVRHPARFVLIGSGNPEEGELRPQLLDRFGLAVDVSTPTDIDERIEVIKRRDSYERDPESFLRKWSRQDGRLRRQIVRARENLDEVGLGDDILGKAAEICIALETDGSRGELTLMRAARAHAALHCDEVVRLGNLRAIAPMALGHRLRRNPLDESSAGVRVQRVLDELLP